MNPKDTLSQQHPPTPRPQRTGHADITDSNENEIRKAKVTKMREEQLEPWPANKSVSHTTKQAIAEYQQDPSKPTIFTVAGRLMIHRDHGKTFFGVIQDRDGKIQIYVKKDEVGEHAFEHFKKYVDVGDIIWVKGPIFITKMGEITIKVEEFELLSKCLHPLPEKFHGLTDIEQRYRQRYLDLISNPESKEKFKKRSLIVQEIRSFLQKKDFLEVETPMLHPIPGGAAARPFVTHHNAYDMDLYLRIAPELYLKRLVVGGFERVFEINRNFRNEGVSTRHNPEFTMLEFYMAYGDYKDGMELTEELIKDVVQKNFGTLQVTFQDKVLDFSDFKKLSVFDSIVEIGKIPADQITPENIDKLIKQHNIALHTGAGYGVKLFALFEMFVEQKIVQPTFIIGYPIEISPLAKRDPQDPNIAARFELFIAGMECANGFTELNDPFDQAERFKGQALAREGGDVEAHHYDADYIKALEFALPPTVGVGIGIDRLVMFLTNTSSIKDMILFPTLKAAHQVTLLRQGYEGQEEHGPRVKEETSKLVVDPAIFKKFPGTCLGIVIGHDLKNSADNIEQINQMLRDQEDKLKALFANQPLAEHPSIKAWREAYQRFGANPEKYKSSVENLSIRILAGNPVKHVSTLVDLYNSVSLKYLLPAGGEDIDSLDGNVELTFATAHEIPVVAFGEKEAKKPEVGEVIYKDQGGTLCRRWNWRGTERSKLTTKTKNAFFVLEGLPPVSREHVEMAVAELAKLISQYCEGTVVTMIVDESRQEAPLAKNK